MKTTGETARAVSGWDTVRRRAALRRLLEEGESSTQDELRAELARQKFVVTQSTISRDLRRIGAIKMTDASGQTIYRLPVEEMAPPTTQTSLEAMVLDIRTNGSMIVVITPPGTASLIARHLDHSKPGGILGTIAGDDTIFVVPPQVKNIQSVVRAIQDSFRTA